MKKAGTIESVASDDLIDEGSVSFRKRKISTVIEFFKFSLMEEVLTKINFVQIWQKSSSGPGIQELFHELIW